jgi:lysozyme
MLAAAEHGLEWAQTHRRASAGKRAVRVAELRRLVERRQAQIAYAERMVKGHRGATDISAAGIEFIAEFEGFSPVAYKPVAAERYLTIGFGHYGPDVRPGQHISQQQAYTLLRRDAAKAVNAVRALYLNLRQGEFDALVSLAFNLGPGVLRDSTTIGKALRAHDLPGAAAALELYARDVTGQPLEGLVRRRAAERQRFLTG